ncbi:glycosyltransferase [Lactobacillus helveticus]|uniref:Ss-1,4-galactosyltransferase n=1 Tax=Lactobacillus helveticus CIRM-BIA 951 TaxID=1226334 RepID=U6F5F9_LACHE|nr:glycosyltransferase [Lactobacillus helveticus]MDY0991106.1 glycosyltransferase [Lactobacillus helveticus]MDY1001771.1 glycosyltransferase [Lactobacillus helveticus]MEB2873628.1 glycosyltransferase [Lactobacillus helveticus]CDI59171.1 Ss-1,4-galactosyltransferase [Lactobacillus helveticus CIRM-BIA 951]
MKTDSMISIIVPVYNVEKYLDRCVQSILIQSFKRFELILVNDGSTDNSFEICQKYRKKDSRVILISQENKGLSAARNTGLNNAHGDYICFIDSDDFIEKDYLKLLLNNLKSNNADISICEYFLSNEKGKKYSIVKLNEPKNISILSGKNTFNYFYEDNCVPNVVAWNKLYKASLFKELRYKEGYYFEDEFIARPLFYAAKRVSFLREPLYNYVQRSGSIMNSAWNLKKYEDLQLMYEERIDYFKNNDRRLYKLAVQQYKNWIIGIDYENCNNLDKLYLSKLQKEYRKYFGIRISNTPKAVLKDLLGALNIRSISKLKSIL